MGLEMKLAKLTQKWVLFGGLNMALTNPCFKDQIGLICEGGPVEKREGEKKRKKRRGRRGFQAMIKPKRYGNSP